jgi:hypothetical protein
MARRTTVTPIEAAPASTPNRVPATTSIAVTMIPIAIAVPRSGSTRMRAQAAPTTAPSGRTSSASDCGAGLLER